MRVMRPRRNCLEKSIGVLTIRRTESQPSLGRTTRVPHAIPQGRRQAFGVVGPDGPHAWLADAGGYVVQTLTAVDFLSVRAMCQPLAGAPFGSARS